VTCKFLPFAAVFLNFASGWQPAASRARAASGTMMIVRTRAGWLLTLPLLVASETAGHAVVVRFLDPHGERHTLLARTTEDYLGYLYAAAVICLLLGVAVLARRAAASFRGHDPWPLPSWKLAGIPSVAFLAQEHLEAIFHNGGDWLVISEPVVLLGAALQLPFGLLALWLVRALLRVADGLGYALARRAGRRARVRPAPQLVHGPQDGPLRLLGLARGLAERAPPSFA